MLKLLKAAALIALVLAIGPALADDLAAGHNVALNDQAVANASQKAQAEVDVFLARLANPPVGTSNYAVKLGIVDRGNGYALTKDVGLDKVEYFWLVNIGQTPSGYVGILGNRPETVTHVAAGEPIPFTKADIFDWLYLNNGKMVGNYTACPVLEAGPIEDLKQYEAETGASCE
jgi:uncharacterized protein YegJ (DUF2314 family)